MKDLVREYHTYYKFSDVAYCTTFYDVKKGMRFTPEFT